MNGTKTNLNTTDTQLKRWKKRPDAKGQDLQPAASGGKATAIFLCSCLRGVPTACGTTVVARKVARYEPPG